MHFEQKKSDFSRKIETELSEHLFFMSRKTVKKNLFAGKDYNFLQFFRPLSARKEWLLPWIVGMSAWAGFSQSAGKNWPKSYFFWKKNKFLFINVDLQIEIFIFWLSNFCRLVKSPSHVSIETCSQKMQFFLKKIIIFLLYFQFWLKQFGVSGTIAESFSKLFLTVHINHSWRFCINEKRVTFFWRYWSLREKFLDLCEFSEKVRARSSKLFSASPAEDSVDKLFF